MEKYLNEIICGDNVEVLQGFPDGCIDLTVTSPPYDNLRTYNGFEWDFEALAKELYRVTKDGGVVVWVVNDATINGSETGTSFRQALYFMETGFRLYDTMIWEKINPMPINDRRYQQCFEYMFVFSKGVPITANIKLIKKSEGTINRQRYKMTTTQKGYNGEDVTPTIYSGGDRSEFTKDRNIQRYAVGYNAKNDKIASKHPAIFPEKLAEDHIISWSNPGDIILDPFIGSGTTAKMAALNDRHYIGIDISEEYCELARKRVSEAKE